MNNPVTPLERKLLEQAVANNASRPGLDTLLTPVQQQRLANVRRALLASWVGYDEFRTNLARPVQRG